MKSEKCDLENHRYCKEFVQEKLEPLIGRRTRDGRTVLVNIAGGSFVVKFDDECVADGHFFCLENRYRSDSSPSRIGRYRFRDDVISPEDMVKRLKGVLE